MMENEAAWQALLSRDARFDGVFFVGVSSTGIYCRPVCPVKPPLRRHCHFFISAAAAEQAGFRPCLRCRPELAPGNAPMDQGGRIAEGILAAIDEGLSCSESSVGQLAARFGLSSRQLRRVVQQQLGVSPVALTQTRRLLLAKQLLTDTQLPVTDVAFASGFRSLRRFHAAFSDRYRLAPRQLRRQPGGVVGDHVSLLLSYRPPYDWDAMLNFLARRAILHVETIEEKHYLRTVQLGSTTGWIRVGPVVGKPSLRVDASHSLLPVLPALLGRLRQLFDLAAQPDRIAAQLGRDPTLSASVAAHPGLRVAGAFDGFELAVRAILGQQVTVKAATTLAGRFSDTFGAHIATPFPALTRLAPPPQRLMAASIDEIAQLGIVSARARAIIALAQAMGRGELQLSASSDPERTLLQLMTLPGIGPWTAHYIAMRALR